MTFKFPKDFLWGSSTSSYQVEGGINNSDWSFCFPAGRACDHYHRYKEDFTIAKKLGQNAHRFSVEWSRIEPREGIFDDNEITHYKDVLTFLKNQNIKTFLTLHHFTNPIWFSKEGGWSGNNSAFHFKRFAEKLFFSFGDLVDFWITINEPMIYLSAGYLNKRWPPFKKDLFLFKKSFSNMIAAHKIVFNKFHETDPNVKVGIAKNNQSFRPSRKNSLLDKFSVSLSRYASNEFFLNKIKKHLDFLGINYYFHRKVKFPFKTMTEGNIFNDLKWVIYPKGIYNVLTEANHYQLPIYITENGLADKKDDKRETFIKEHLKWIHQAISDGSDVRGYLHWSLMDNFEWDKGFDPRFGLLKIDYNTLERKIRKSAYSYAEICKNNAIN